MSKTNRILLGISGGIAAYKTPDLVRLLAKRGVSVRVALTRGAEQFVAPMALETVSGQKVWQADFATQDSPLEHLDESLTYGAALIAPATANLIAKLAHGMADDVLTTTVLALTCPVYLAPAMNPRMYANPAVQENLKTLKKRGWIVIPPACGVMACGEEGEGRLPDINHLADTMQHALGLNRDMEGIKLLLTAGPTEEPIDDVRFISNRSSGRMGVAIAAAAADRGADVMLIHGPLAVPVPDNVTAIPVRKAEEMLAEVENRFDDCDILVMTAAVADFRPDRSHTGKIKKHKADKSITLLPNPDILAEMGRRKKGQTLVGFAAETEEWENHGREKLVKKNADLICVNDVSRKDIGFESDYNEIIFLDRTGGAERSARAAKAVLAETILDKALAIHHGQAGRTSADGGA